MGESPRHLEQRTALYQVIRDAFRDRAAVGSEHFVYWDAADPRRCCCPDLVVQLGKGPLRDETWKTWKRGAPDLAVEIISASDATDRPWEAKLERYRQLGVDELVRFDPADPERPLRIWDQVEGDLVERRADDPEFARCDTLEAYFCLRTEEGEPWLYLSRDREGKRPYLTPDEARARAEARVRELEAEIERLKRQR